MDSQQQQPAERIKQANNILITVSSNPSVDQLAALLGLTISLNKMNKHATAVFSGDIPSTLEFLQPEKTIEKNTDSLRDFIIALDKSKADKLRYKVEDRVVKIFITPYRTSISDKDLEFSQGDFNVDVVIALGVHNQAELDHAITTHGRILHDATIITLNTQPGGELGSINWVDSSASSLSEIAVRLINVIDKSLIDGQIATAFLTGIVAETDRFSNAKTSPQTMSISAQLMSSGANQQLVATELAEPVAPALPAAAPIAVQAPGEASAVPEPVKKSNDGTLEIAHDQTKRPEEEAAESLPKDAKTAETTETPLPAPDNTEEKDTAPEPVAPPQISIDEHGSLASNVDAEEAAAEALLPPPRSKVPEISHHSEAPKMILEPPAVGEEMLAGGGAYETEDASGLPGMPAHEEPRLNGSDASSSPSLLLGDSKYEANAPGTSFLGDQPLEPAQSKESTPESDHDKTLSEIEKDVHAHQDETPAAKSDTPAIPVITPTTPTPPTLTPATAFTDGAMLPPVQDSFSPASPPIEEDVASIPNMPISTPAVATPTVDGARDAVAAAMSADTDQPLGAIQALNANPGLSVGHDDVVSEPPAIQLPPAPVQPWTPTVNAAGDIVPQAVADPNAPPSVPPPMMPTPRL